MSWMDDEIVNARIKSARITNADHGCLTIWIDLDYGSAGQGFGGYNLYSPAMWESIDNNAHKNYAGHWIWRVMEVAEVNDWNDLKGKTVRVEIRNGLVYKIGHILKDKWFCPKEEFGNE